MDCTSSNIAIWYRIFKHLMHSYVNLIECGHWFCLVISCCGNIRFKVGKYNSMYPRSYDFYHVSCTLGMEWSQYTRRKKLPGVVYRSVLPKGSARNVLWVDDVPRAPFAHQSIERYWSGVRGFQLFFLISSLLWLIHMTVNQREFFLISSLLWLIHMTVNQREFKNKE
jgi:hypothetical protein